MKTILVGTDGSECSSKAIRLAAELAKGFNAKMKLSYVVPPLAVTDIYGALASEYYAREEEAAEQLLKKAVDLTGGVSCEPLVLRGDVAETLADAAERVGADLIVVGSRGRSAVTRVLLGSVADRLVHISKKPVLVAR